MPKKCKVGFSKVKGKCIKKHKGERRYTKNYKRTRVKDPKLFDKRGFRVKDVGRKGHTKIIVACPKGHWNSKTKRCNVGMQTQAILKER